MGWPETALAIRARVESTQLERIRVAMHAMGVLAPTRGRHALEASLVCQRFTSAAR
jgi:hypothetical protein